MLKLCIYLNIWIVRFSRDNIAWSALQATKKVCNESNLGMDPKYDFK